MESISKENVGREETIFHFMEDSAFIEQKNNAISSIVTHNASSVYLVFKRLLDITISFFGILLLIPVFLAIAACIKFEDGGSIFHFREIVGYRSRRFFALKFRTMIPNADSYLENHPELKQEYLQNIKLKNDPRITRVGKFLRKTSLDELPQLFNVLIGQMSLVGPRIIHPSELSRYGEYAQRRLLVMPGITGLWQLYGRQNDTLEIRIALDMQYIDKCSFFLDIIILVKTLKVLFIQTGT